MLNTFFHYLPLYLQVKKRSRLCIFQLDQKRLFCNKVFDKHSILSVHYAQQVPIFYSCQG